MTGPFSMVEIDDSFYIAEDVNGWPQSIARINVGEYQRSALAVAARIVHLLNAGHAAQDPH